MYNRQEISRNFGLVVVEVGTRAGLLLLDATGYCRYAVIGTWDHRGIQAREADMDAELWKELRIADASTLSAIEYAQECVVIHEQTLRAMGLVPPEPTGQTVSNSQLVYMNPIEMADQYGNIPENY